MLVIFTRIVYHIVDNRIAVSTTAVRSLYEFIKLISESGSMYNLTTSRYNHCSDDILYMAKSAPQNLWNLKQVIEFEHSIIAAGALVVLKLNLVLPDRKFDPAVLVLNVENGWRCIMCLCVQTR